MKNYIYLAIVPTYIKHILSQVINFVNFLTIVPATRHIICLLDDKGNKKVMVQELIHLVRFMSTKWSYISNNYPNVQHSLC